MSNDLMTIEEVAEYFRVSERTVYDWAQKGEIPGGKIGTVWRFKRSEVERLVNERLSGEKEIDEKTNVRVKDILSPERVILMSQRSKRDSLIELAHNLSTAPQVKDSKELEIEILKRENLISTSIGRGLAIPHVRLSSVTDLVVSVGISSVDIEDFSPVDNMPVRILIMIAAAKSQHSYYLRALAFFSEKLKDSALRTSLLEAKSKEEAYRLLIG